MKSLSTEVQIDAPAERVWSVLSDFASYRSWNPFIVDASGEPAIGGRLHLRMEPPGGKAMSFKPRVTGAEPPRLLEWLGTLGVRGLFDGRHRFELADRDGGTVVTQSEEFTGILVPFVWNSMRERTRSGFEELNQALKTRAESAE
jgi:hypothetical protein